MRRVLGGRTVWKYSNRVSAHTSSNTAIHAWQEDQQHRPGDGQACGCPRFLLFCSGGLPCLAIDLYSGTLVLGLVAKSTHAQRVFNRTSSLECWLLCVFWPWSHCLPPGRFTPTLPDLWTRDRRQFPGGARRVLMQLVQMLCFSIQRPTCSCIHTNTY